MVILCHSETRANYCGYLLTVTLLHINIMGLGTFVLFLSVRMIHFPLVAFSDAKTKVTAQKNQADIPDAHWCTKQNRFSPKLLLKQAWLLAYRINTKEE